MDKEALLNKAKEYIEFIGMCLSNDYNSILSDIDGILINLKSESAVINILEGHAHKMQRDIEVFRENSESLSSEQRSENLSEVANATNKLGELLELISKYENELPPERRGR